MKNNGRTTWIWWTLLNFAMVINLIILILIWLLIPPTNSVTTHLLLLGSLYTIICAIRSLLPRVDLERHVFVDHWTSSIAIGRSLATVGELGFAVFIALLIYTLSLFHGISLPVLIPIFFVLIIFLAQVFCWHGTFTLNHFSHAIEETLWFFFAAGVFIFYLYVILSVEQVHLAFHIFMAFIFLLYAIYLLLIDIPMYISRSCKTITRLKIGLTTLKDVTARRVFTRDWKLWRSEALWMTPYFVGGPLICFISYYFTERFLGI